MNPCLLIPHFDHAARIGSVLDDLAGYDLPAIVVDDGSDAAARAILVELAERHAWVELELRERNGGRGAALKTGYRAAWRRGFSHALQLDAAARKRGTSAARC